MDQAHMEFGAGCETASESKAARTETDTTVEHYL